MSSEGLPVGQWVIPESELEERFSTTGGPGGQHANRTATGVTLRFDIGSSSLPAEIKQKLSSRLAPVVEVQASESRSQWRNRAVARQRMAERLEAALVEPPPRKPTKKPLSADQKRLAEKKARGQLKRDRQRPETD